MIRTFQLLSRSAYSDIMARDGTGISRFVSDLFINGAITSNLTQCLFIMFRKCVRLDVMVGN